MTGKYFSWLESLVPVAGQRFYWHHIVARPNFTQGFLDDWFPRFLAGFVGGIFGLCQQSPTRI